MTSKVALVGQARGEVTVARRRHVGSLCGLLLRRMALDGGPHAFAELFGCSSGALTHPRCAIDGPRRHPRMAWAAPLASGRSVRAWLRLLRLVGRFCRLPSFGDLAGGLLPWPIQVGRGWLSSSAAGARKDFVHAAGA